MGDEKQVRRLACLADVHGNTAALDAVLASPELATVDAVAFLGCLTTGPDPDGVLERCLSLDLPVQFLAGNGERAVVELADGKEDDWPMGPWVLAHHSSASLRLIRSWPTQLIYEDLSARLCHGSPRSDIELLTPGTPDARIEAATEGVAERVIVHGHTHLQYQRTVGARTIVGAGSVGIPYTAGTFGAYWTILGETVEPVVTPYDYAEVERRVHAIGYPSERFLEQLRTPPTPAEIIADAESKEFSD